ncbi:hypothetical protein P3S68_027782 [Capsicum galapagoense]
MMEHPQYYAPHRIGDSSSRPSLGFPLGTAFLLIAVFSLSGIFSCWYHWNRIRSLGRSTDLEAGDEPASFKSKLTYMNDKQNQSYSSQAVVMPGDQVPKFIALPCPCQPPRWEKLVEEEQKPLPLPSPLKQIRVMGFLL